MYELQWGDRIALCLSVLTRHDLQLFPVRNRSEENSSLYLVCSWTSVFSIWSASFSSLSLHTFPRSRHWNTGTFRLRAQECSHGQNANFDPPRTWNSRSLLVHELFAVCCEGCLWRPCWKHLVVSPLRRKAYRSILPQPKTQWERIYWVRWDERVWEGNICGALCHKYRRHHAVPALFITTPIWNGKYLCPNLCIQFATSSNRTSYSHTSVLGREYHQPPLTQRSGWCASSTEHSQTVCRHERMISHVVSSPKVQLHRAIELGELNSDI